MVCRERAQKDCNKPWMGIFHLIKRKCALKTFDLLSNVFEFTIKYLSERARGP